MDVANVVEASRAAVAMAAVAMAAGLVGGMADRQI